MKCFYEEACKPIVKDTDTAGWLPDPLRRTALRLADRIDQHTDRTIVTIAGVGFDKMLRMLLESLKRTQTYPHRVVLLLLDNDIECKAIADHYGVSVIHTRHLEKPGPGSKSGLYACGHLIQTNHLLCLDADTIVHESLEHIFKTLEDTPGHPIFMVRDLNEPNNLMKELAACYKSDYDEVKQYMPGIKRKAWRGINCNDGVFAGTREAILKADRLIRRWDTGPWLRHKNCCWRNQGVWNLAVHSACNVVYGRDIDNVQLHVGPGVTWEAGKPYYKGCPVNVLHFVGRAKVRHVSDQRLPECG